MDWTEASLLICAPLTALGLVSAAIPWWILPALMATLALVRSSERARLHAWPLPILLAAGVAISRGQGLGAALQSFWSIAALGLALGFAVDRIREGSLGGLALLVALWLIGPSPAGLVALLASVVLFGESRQRRFAATPAPGWRAALTLALAILALGAASALLPSGRPAPAAGAAAAAGAVSHRSAKVVRARKAPPREAAPGTRVTRRAVALPRWLGAALIGSGFALMVLTVLSGMALLVRARGSPGHRPAFSWTDLVLPLALLSVVAMLLVYGASGQRGRVGGNPLAGLARLLSFVTTLLGRLLPSKLPKPTFLPELALLLIGLLIFLALALLVLVVAVFRGQGSGPEEGAALLPTPEAGPEGEAPGIRALYRQLLAWLGAQGLSRAPGETPSELADRAGRKLPGQQRQIQGITSAYLPVRYRGDADSSGLERAQQEYRSLKGESRGDSSFRREGPG